MKSCRLHTIESVSEVDKMKLEKGVVGIGLALVVNYLLHRMFAPGIYLGVVLCGLLVFYARVNVEKMMKQGVIRFVLILSVSLIMKESLGFVQSMNWLVLCVLCAAISQRLTKCTIDFLENISIINMILCGVCFCGVLLQMIHSVILMMSIALIQPSGLSLELDGVHFLQLKR